MNKVILTNSFIGKKGVDLKFAPGSGKAIATYSVAVPKEFSKEKEYDYINVVTWGNQGEWLANNQDRIKKIGVIGRLQTRSYDAKDGSKKYVTEVISEHIEVEEWNNEVQQEGFKRNQSFDANAYGADITPVEDGDGIPF